MTSSVRRRLGGCAALLAVLATAAGCSSTRDEDQLLQELANLDKETIYERAETLYQEGEYEQARRYFSFVYDTFPNDPLGHKAALRVADTYAVRKDVTSLTEARLRYRDFANRYPNDPDRDYALMMVGRTYSARTLRPDRDLSNIHEALNAYRQLINLYPDSDHAAEAEQEIDGLRELLAEHELIVAQFYERNKRWIGALWRLQYIQENYPDFSKIDEVEAMVEAIEAEIEEQERRFRELLEQRSASAGKSDADGAPEEEPDEVESSQD